MKTIRQGVATVLILLVVGSAGVSLCAGEDGSPLASSVILLIGDGMGEVQRTVARWASVGVDGQLNMDLLEIQDGLATTRNANGGVTDSAAAATALATGVKTTFSVVGLDPAMKNLTTILELAQAAGKSVGLVTSTSITHATPAAFAAHVVTRYMFQSIAKHLFEARVDVLLGGGEEDFLPRGTGGCHTADGKRSDSRNLVLESHAAGYITPCTREDLLALEVDVEDRALGLFSDSALALPLSPTLAEMTAAAIEIPSADPDGFFLMIEGGQIDRACHDNDVERAIDTTLGFDAAVGTAISYATAREDVLVIVTADHETGGMTASLDASDTSTAGYSAEMSNGESFSVSWNSGEHTAIEVPVLGMGPHSELLSGVYENTWIFDVMLRAMALPDPRGE